MRIFLANAPWRRGNLYGIRAGSRWPFMLPVEPGDKIPRYMPFPFFLAYSASLLIKNGYDTVLVDALAEGLSDDEFMEKVKDAMPDIIVLETSTPSFNTDIKWIKKIKSAFPSVKTVLCGTHATVFDTALIDEYPELDIIMRGEYEFILLELCEAIKQRIGEAGVKGITYRQDNKTMRNPDRQLEADINKFPWPERKQLPMFNYNDTFAGMPSPNVQVWASRGCPFTCVFCNWPGTMYGGHSYRVRDVKDTVDEIEWLLKTYEFKAFYLDHDTVNIGKDRILAICSEIKKRGICVPWAVMARADTTDTAVLDAMKDAGLFAIKFGVESGDAAVLERSAKKLNLEKVRESTAYAKKLGIKVHHTYTFGLPGETADSIRKTIAFVKELNPDSAQFSLVTPFPGTTYFNELKKKGMITSFDWDRYDGANDSVIRTETMTGEELKKWLDCAIREWNFHMFATRLLKRPFRTFVNALKKPDYALIYIKNLFKGIFK